MLLRYIRGKCEPAYPALYSVLYKQGADSPGPVFDGLARWHSEEIFGKVNTTEGELVEGETEIIAFFQFPAELGSVGSILEQNNYVELREE